VRLGRTTALHFTSQVLVSVAGFAATLAIANFGGADLLGVYTVAAALVFWLNVPSTAVGDALTKRLSEGGDRSGLLASTVLLNGAGGLAIALTLIVATPIVDSFVGAPVSELVAFLFLGNVALITALAALKGEKRVAESGGITALERVIRSVIHVTAVVLGVGVAALVGGHAVASLVAAVVGLILVRTDLRWPSTERVRSLLEYARYSWLGNLRTRAFAWMDTIVLAFFVGPALIGIYEVSWNLASLFALVAISVQKTLFPELSELSVQENYDRIHHYLDEGLVFTGVFIIPGLFGALVLGERVLLIYSEEFTRGAEVLTVLVVARMLAAYGEQFNNALNASDRPDVAFRINLVFVSLNLILNVGLVAELGWTGAAIATAISSGTMLVLSYAALVPLIGTPSLPVRELLVQVGASAVMALVVIGVRGLVPRTTPATVGLVALGAGVYLVALLVASNRIRRKFMALVGRGAGV